jgi:DNA-binding NtrC family response regulator
MRPKILFLDHDADILETYGSIFANEDIELLLETDGNSALIRIRTEHPKVAVIDINLRSTISGLDVLREAKKRHPKLAVIITTGNSSTQSAIEAMKYGAYDYLTKPLDFHKLKNTIRKALEYSTYNRKVHYMADPGQLNENSGDADIMIGSSPEMFEIWKMVGKIADSDASVIIQGESGTGKELLAKAIFSNSRRKDKPFLAVNCAAIPENLIESELFGHEKGAFTDAHSRRIGKFEHCNGGTIFLDEIGEMSLSSQGKLLRVLEGQNFERVGGNETIKVNVRIIAASNRSLVSAVKEKRFRLDLFYRLKVIAFFLPNLHERQEDIPLLVDLFIRQFSKMHGKTIKGVASESLDLLMSHPWEGNIRELKNVINTIIIMCKGYIIMPEDIEAVIGTKKSHTEIVPQELGDDIHSAFTHFLEPVFDKICSRYKGAIFEQFTMGMEMALIGMALQRNDNNKVLTAKLLGISRNTLRDRVERYNLS